MDSVRQTRRRGSILYRGGGTWYVRVSLGTDGSGKQIRIGKVVHGTKRDADRCLTELLKRKDDGIPVAYSQQRLGEWIEEWLSTWRNNISDRTRSDYERVFRRYLPKDLLGRKLARLTPKDIQDVVNELSARGLSPRTVRILHGALRACLNTALRLGKVPRNVATLVDLPARGHRELRCFTPGEAQRFLQAAEAEQRDRDAAGNDQACFSAFFITLLLTGLRPGEGLALRWSDLDGSYLRIQRAQTVGATNNKLIASTKTGRSRVLPLGERALRTLQHHRVRQAKWKLKLGDLYQDQGLIFANETGGLLDAQNIVNRHFKPLLKRAGLPAIRLYDLRHSHATLLMAAGEHPKVVQERLGHSTITLTLDTYTHVVPGMQELASSRLEALLSSSATAAAR
jgi:integrase